MAANPTKPPTHPAFHHGLRHGSRRLRAINHIFLLLDCEESSQLYYLPASSSRVDEHLHQHLTLFLFRLLLFLSIFIVTMDSNNMFPTFSGSITPEQISELDANAIVSTDWYTPNSVCLNFLPYYVLKTITNINRSVRLRTTLPNTLPILLR